MKTIALKFGGSSLADAGQFRKAADIILSDPQRRYVVASAPGKRFSGDTKVTDMLYSCCRLAQSGGDYLSELNKIQERFASILSELKIDFDLDGEIAVIAENLKNNPQSDYTASRGEYLNSKILAKYIGYPFIDPAECIFFNEHGAYDPVRTNAVLSQILSGCEKAVVAGFYGSLPDGTVHTFSRGGSDLTGSIVAAAAGADIYENWTDVSGMCAADPRIVKDPKSIEYITYRELRELSYMGASVLHEDAVFPARRAGIPINIRNTNAPDDKGTVISAALPDGYKPGMITGIAGKKGFSCLEVEKSLMNNTVGFGATLLQILARFGIPFEHCPTGIDTMMVIVNTESLEGKREKLTEAIKEALSPDSITLQDGLALLAVVGQGIPEGVGVAGKTLSAVAHAGVNIKMIDSGSNGLNIIICVDENDYEEAIRGIYREILQDA